MFNTEIVFATNNQNKMREVAKLLVNKIKILSLNDIECFEEIPETSATIEGNAIQKAKYVIDNFQHNCFADDTGLEIEALNGEPGVYSARYAGEPSNAEANITKVLQKLECPDSYRDENRKARFKTVIALVIDNEISTFEGMVEGTILKEPKGTAGFGYDAIFQPKGYSKSFAEMTMSEKNAISHRAIAVQKLVEYLKTL